MDAAVSATAADRGVGVEQGRDVDDRQVWCGAHELVTYCSATGA